MVCVTHFVIGGVVFLWGRGGVSTGAVRAVTAVTLAVQAESDGGTGRGQRSITHRPTDRQNILSYSLALYCAANMEGTVSRIDQH